MLSLDELPFDRDLTGLKLVTLDGGGGAGKGTAGAAIEDGLNSDGRTVDRLDRGLLYRSFGRVAIDGGVDLADPTQADSYLNDAEAHAKALTVLAEAATMSKEEVRRYLRRSEVSVAASLIGDRRIGQEAATRLMFARVEAAGESGIDTMIIDGRGLGTHARTMHNERRGVLVLGFHLVADAVVSGSRAIQNFSNVDNMSDQEVRDWAKAVQRAYDRNRKDSEPDRGVNRLRHPDNAMMLDLLAGLPEDQDERYDLFDHAVQATDVFVDTSYADRPEQTIEPVLALTRYALQEADVCIRSFNACRREVVYRVDQFVRGAYE